MDSRPPSKWVSGLLSVLFPGLGHFYLGMMQRGLLFMLLLAGDIFGIVICAMKGIVPLIVLLGVMVPILFFYSLFDALRMTDVVSGKRMPHAPVGAQSFGGGSLLGFLLFGIGIFAFTAASKPEWLERVTNGSGALIGGVLLLAAGAVMLLSGSRKK